MLPLNGIAALTWIASAYYLRNDQRQRNRSIPSALPPLHHPTPLRKRAKERGGRKCQFQGHGNGREYGITSRRTIRARRRIALNDDQLVDRAGISPEIPQALPSSSFSIAQIGPSRPERLQTKDSEEKGHEERMETIFYSVCNFFILRYVSIRRPFSLYSSPRRLGSSDSES